MIYDDYIAYTREYVAKYGEKTVVFMQVGDFFELYAIQNDQQLIGADIYKVCDLCNIQVSRKNKAMIENTSQNPLMAGFPLSAISKFTQLLVQNQYTIVLIRQVTPPPNPKREVTEIISPSTYMNSSTNDGIYLMTIFWDQDKSTTLTSVGITCLDITTGASNIYEAYSTTEDPNFSLDEILRWIQMFQPKEILLMGETFSKEVAQFVDNHRYITVHHQWGDAFQKLYKSVSYQNAIIEKAFQSKSLLTPIETIGLERLPLAVVSYCAMIQFTYEHNPTLIQKIEIPKILHNQKHLILESNSVQQLNILSNSNQDLPLIQLLNRCATAFGSRLFKERLLNPIVSISKLNTSYDQIEFYQKENRYKTIIQHLAYIIDLERMLRKIALCTLHPSEWNAIEISLDSCCNVFKFLDLEKELNGLNQMIKYHKDNLNMEECNKYNFTEIYTSLFQRGIHSDLDEASNKVESSQHLLKSFASEISKIGENDTTLCRLDYNDRDGYFLSITKKRWDNALLSNKHSGCAPGSLASPSPIQIQVQEHTVYLKDCKVKPISSSSSVLRITHKLIEEYSDRMMSEQRKLSNLNIKYYKEFLSTYDLTYHLIWRQTIKKIAAIDVCATNAKNANEYGYTRPSLVASEDSYFNATQIRHPIIERLNQDHSYVSNSVSLGNDKKGLLLYGINASGKSSLMKAIGLNIIMAQSGMFVPSESIELAPYYHLFTRIMSSDNIYRGHSTFTVEMLELKNILNRCDQHSLVLGDELCSGTEFISAISIVSAGIQYLLSKKATFVFATHLHELVDISFIKQSQEIWIAHLHIEMDEITGKIIYDRVLKEGHGSSLYGIEVCRALKLPLSFLKVANQIRQEIQKESPYIVNPVISKYNNRIIVSECKLCGNPARETHHIVQQKDANEYGISQSHSQTQPQPIHIHDKSNLIVLCESCHLKQHHGVEKIAKIIKTSEGNEVEMETISVKPTNDIILTDLLKYSSSGWKYRLTKRNKWRGLDIKNYDEVYFGMKNKCKNKSEWLPPTYTEFLEKSVDYQSEYLELS